MSELELRRRPRAPALTDAERRQVAERRESERRLDRAADRLVAGIHGGIRGEKKRPEDERCRVCRRPIAKAGDFGRCFWCTEGVPRRS